MIRLLYIAVAHCRSNAIITLAVYGFMQATAAIPIGIGMKVMKFASSELESCKLMQDAWLGNNAGVGLATTLKNYHDFSLSGSGLGLIRGPIWLA
jgi:hypothetical protein